MIPVTLHQMQDACPTWAEVRSIDEDIDLAFEPDPTADEPPVCGRGGPSLTPLEAYAYRHLLMARAIDFDRPLPWTELSLYDWIVQTADGIRYRPDIDKPFCCDPPRVVNLTSCDGGCPRYHVPSPDEIVRQSWAPGVHLGLLVHEIRHIEVGAHTSDTISDQSWADLNGYGASAALYWWMAEFAPHALLETPNVQHGHYRNVYRFGTRQLLDVRIVDEVDLEQAIVTYGWTPDPRRPAEKVSRTARPLPQLLTSCPSIAEVRAIDSHLEIHVDAMALGGRGCSRDDGSVNLDRLNERSYQALRVMSQVGEPGQLPWTGASLWDWFADVVTILHVDLGNRGASASHERGTVRVQIPTHWYPGLREDDLEGLAPLLLEMIRQARATEIADGSTGGTTPDQAHAVVRRLLGDRLGADLASPAPEATSQGELHFYKPSDDPTMDGYEIRMVDGVLTISNVPPVQDGDQVERAEDE